MLDDCFYFVGMVLFEALLLLEDFILLQEEHLYFVEQFNFSVCLFFGLLWPDFFRILGGF
jgi:hypothetical protein